MIYYKSGDTLQTSTNVIEDHAMRIMEYVPILLDRSRVHVPQDTLVMDLLAEVTRFSDLKHDLELLTLKHQNVSIYTR